MVAYTNPYVMRTRTKLKSVQIKHEPWRFDGTLVPSRAPDDVPLTGDDVPAHFFYDPGFPVIIEGWDERHVMSDVPKGRGRENPCHHSITTVIRADWLRKGNSNDRNMRARDDSGAPQFIIKNPMGFYEEGTVRGPLPEMPPDLPFPDLSGRALTTMWPEVEAAVSLINFVYELKDLATLPKTLASLRDLVAALAGRNKANSPIADISDVYLQNEFGLKPLVGDVQSIASAVSSFQDKFSEYFGKQGVILRRHYTSRYRPDSVPWSLERVFTTLHGTPTTHIGKHTSGVPEVEYTATLCYSYSLPGLDPTSEHARDAFARDLLGIQWNPAVLWNAIPYTFLVDYVAKVGDWLDQFKIRNIEPLVVVWDFIESIKYAKSRDHWVLPWGRPSNTWCWCGRMQEIVYERRLVVPDTYATLVESGLSTREIINMAALGGGQTRRR